VEVKSILLCPRIVFLFPRLFNGAEKIYKYLTRKDLAELSAMSVEGAVRVLSE
jgi:hypothetical protein